MEVEGTLGEEESDGDDLILDVTEDCPLLASDLVLAVLEALTTGEVGTEGSERLIGSVVVEELVFFPTIEPPPPPPLLICFFTGSCGLSGKLPVLFLLMAGAELEAVFGVDLTMFETLLGSIFFLVVPVAEPETFKEDETVGFITLLVAFTFSAEDCVFVFVSKVGTLSKDPSPPSIKIMWFDAGEPACLKGRRVCRLQVIRLCEKSKSEHL